MLPFIPEFAFAAEVIRSRTHGGLVGADFTRVISRPDWSADIGDASKTGGPAIDLHIHDTHFIGLIAGVPERVSSSGVVAADGGVTYLTTHYLYGNAGPAVTCSSGAMAMNGQPFVHGYEIYLDKATLAFTSERTLTIYTPDGKTKVPKLKGGEDPLSAFTTEIQTAVNGVRDGVEPDLLSGQLARNALALCHKECQSVRTGKTVAV